MGLGRELLLSMMASMSSLSDLLVFPTLRMKVTFLVFTGWYHGVFSGLGVLWSLDLEETSPPSPPIWRNEK